jgi:hypothetical protein
MVPMSMRDGGLNLRFLGGSNSLVELLLIVLFTSKDLTLANCSSR